jgi:hypothetical protein
MLRRNRSIRHNGEIEAYRGTPRSRGEKTVNPIVMVGVAMYYFPFFLLAIWVFELVLAIFLLRKTRKFWIGWAGVIIGSILFLPSLIFIWTWIGQP